MGNRITKNKLLWTQLLKNAGGLFVLDQQTWQQESEGLLTTVFKDGKLVKETTLEEIRERLNNILWL